MKLITKNPEYEILYSRIRSKNYKLTIGIPTFNRVSTLLRTVKSLEVIQDRKSVFIEISDNTEGEIDISQVINFFNKNVEFDFIYIKNLKNIGAARNFNQIFDISPTKRTMMLFDDDELRLEINQVLDSKLLESSDTLYFYNDFKYENPREVSNLKRIKNIIRNGLIRISKTELILTYESLVFSVPSFIGAIYHTEDFKVTRLSDNLGPTGDYFFTMEISKIRPIRRIKLQLVNYYHGNNDSSKVETYTQFPQKNYEYRLKYIVNLMNEDTVKEKKIRMWERSIKRLYVAESKLTTSKLVYAKSRLFQLKINIKHYLNLI